MLRTRYHLILDGFIDGLFGQLLLACIVSYVLFCKSARSLAPELDPTMQRYVTANTSMADLLSNQVAIDVSG